MVMLWFKVRRPIPGIPGSSGAQGQELCLRIGDHPNIILRNAIEVPEGAVYGIIGNALLDGSLEDLAPDRMPDAVAESLLAAAAAGTPQPGPPPRHPQAAGPKPLRFQRWRRVRTGLRSVP